MVEQREFYLVEEVARRCRVPISTVRHWIAIGKLQSGRFGRRRVVRTVDLDTFIAAGFPNPTAPAAEAQA